MFDTPTLSRVYLGCYSPKRQTPPPQCVGGGPPIPCGGPRERGTQSCRIPGGRYQISSSISDIGTRMAELPNVWRLGLFVSREKKNI